MVDVCSKKALCRAEGCGKQQSFGMADRKTAEYCAQHAPEGMVDVKSRKSLIDKPPASCCITHEITYLLPPSRKEERRRKERKGERRRKEKREKRKECPIEAILINHSVKLF